MKCPPDCTCGKHRRKSTEPQGDPAEWEAEMAENYSGLPDLKLTYHDKSHRYYLQLPHEPKLKRATGVSGVAKIAADNRNIQLWHERMVAIGLTVEPEGRNLRENIAAHVDDKDRLEDICEEAKKVAKAHVAADRGTQKHRVLELVLTGQKDKLITDQQRADAVILERTMDRYRLTPRTDLAEQFVVYPEYIVAGRFDAVMAFETADGRVVLVDLKGLSLDTKLPTPTGWTTMGAVSVGDQMFGSDGKPCNVIAKSNVKRIGTYIVTFDDGTKVVCDSEHIWSTTNHRDRTRAKYHKTKAIPTPRSVSEIRDTLRYSGSGERQHWVSIAAPLVLSHVDLPIDPYLLGVWLGDGNRGRGVITKGEDLFDILRSDGHQLGKRYTDDKPNCSTYTVLGLSHLLEVEELLWNKHIPPQYLRASYDQRLHLLQGLMDTDGTWNITRKSAVFNSTDKALAQATQELLLTLGQRAHLAEFQARGFGKTVTAYAVEFRPVGIEPFRLLRKLAKCKAQLTISAHASRRLIKSIEPGPDVETACIAVDSPDSTYLCSEHMIPTHNSGENAILYPHSTGAQLAMYNRAPHISTGLHHGGKVEITEWHSMPDNLDRDVAYVLLVTNDEQVGTLHEIDIQHGWFSAQRALDLIAWRRQLNYGKAMVRPVDDRFTIAARSAQIEDELRIVWKQAAQNYCLTEDLKQTIMDRREVLNGNGEGSAQAQETGT